MCAKKWTKIGQNLGAKAMLSLWTQITLPKLGKKKKKKQSCLKMKATTKPRNGYFFILKHALFILTCHNIIHKHV